MKLYTEEEIIRAIELSDGRSIDEVLAGLTPIELPTDEEIEKMMELAGMEFDESDPYDVSYLGGAIWIRNKIQGGIK